MAYNFEDGQIPNSNRLSSNLIPATVLTESNGNHFLRMTASPEDCGPSFGTTCPRTRAELWIGFAPGTADQMVTYNFSMRIPSSNSGGRNNLLMQLFQGLADIVNSGKTIWIGSQNGRLFLENDLTHTTADLGVISYDQWMNFSLVVYLTTNPSQGRADAYRNGALPGSIVGEATEKIADITNMYLDVIDFGGVLGIADFDNVQISTGGLVPTPTPIPPLPPPSPTSQSLGHGRLSFTSVKDFAKNFGAVRKSKRDRYQNPLLIIPSYR